ncbi:MAG: 1-deoxy-D-xylulose-5-phosphate synthase [Bifidobacteriaceae bacterium]|nr:1-deoxy-D-xylulose-5-phosphate synthase [Bifidobacteriaceae bacterium]
MATTYLKNTLTPAIIKTIPEQELPALCEEIRSTLVTYGQQHGGHIGSNLGVVELSVALHYVFSSPQDQIIFDVSHQSYVHKMLTGRTQAYTDETKYNSITGFTNPEESEHDAFTLGHTGTSIAIACGMAQQRDSANKHSQRNIIAVIGDGALSSAVAFEGLNNAALLKSNLIIILNDNEMSISQNVGGIYDNLAQLRATRGKSEHNIFKDFGLDYQYVEQGNNVHELIAQLKKIKNVDHPIVLHIHTKKGLGLDEIDQQKGIIPGQCEANHWQNPLHASKALPARKYYGQLAMSMLEQRFPDEPTLTIISPATPRSNGITEDFRSRAGLHYVDTGITEEYAAAYAAGIAKAGGTPVLATSATFFQRAYDQIHQELCLNNQPATLLIFAAGISNADNSHSGAFDIAMLANIPNLLYLTPSSEQDYLQMLQWSTTSKNHETVAIRVPSQAVLQADVERNTTSYPEIKRNFENPFNTNTSCPFLQYRFEQKSDTVALLGFSNTMPIIRKAATILEEHDITPSIIDTLQCSYLDEQSLNDLSRNHSITLTVEDGQQSGGYGNRISAWLTCNTNIKAFNLGADKEFTDQIPMQTLLQRYQMTPEQIAQNILQHLA